MRCIAIDDEPLALNIIENFCSKIPFVSLEKCFNSAMDAIDYLKSNKVDLMFLDINMPHLTGVEFVPILENPPMIVFTTAYQNYAITGFDLNATDYIVKPFSFDRFVQAVNKAYDVYKLRMNSVTPTSLLSESGDKYLMIKVEYSTVKVLLKDIIYIEGLKDYIKICTFGKNYVTKSTMKNISDKLHLTEFMRIHKSFIVSINKIDMFENNHILCRTNSGIVKLPLGSQYKDDFNKLIEDNKL